MEVAVFQNRTGGISLCTLNGVLREGDKSSQMIGPKCNDDHKLTCCDEFKQVSATSDKGKAISETEREIMQEEKKKKRKVFK